MKITTSAHLPQSWVGDGLAIAFFQAPTPDPERDPQDKKSLELAPELSSLDAEVLAGTLQELIAESAFKGAAGESASTRVGGSSPIRKVLLLGLGDPAKATTDAWRKAAAQASKWANQAKCKTLALSFPQYNQDLDVTTQALSEGILLATHQDKRFKSNSSNGSTKPKPEPTLEQVELLGIPDSAASIETAQKICSGVILARELVSAPANLVTPITLADTALAIANEYSSITAEILEKEECETLGMGSFLAVARASDLPPKFIHLTYSSGTNDVPKRKVAIVGKGLTFDSGGLNLKTGVGSSIELMKTDMGGAAATLGAAKAIAQLHPPNLEVHFIIAACENMINGKAMRPGDILTASNGKTIEVNNTDAEGRLTLADALVFADKLGVEAIVDLATLTGACVVALGDSIAGMWSTSDELAAQLEKASKSAGEKFWRMPLEEPYFDQLKSVVADFLNTGSRAGGAITGALFLKQFVAKTSAWAHLDIAGPVWTGKDAGYNNAGGTGYPVRTLVNWLLSLS
ncbi:leucyl aminopeptidase [Tumidithrix helvetica PCC 7403]|uniref:leucyl aminopeptidase n=1 Tax=Tumidithrix helvetica TaxID=3457545 RepID=UPI003C9F4B6E